MVELESKYEMAIWSAKMLFNKISQWFEQEV